jgi:MSHA biogenesis protein MshN
MSLINRMLQDLDSRHAAHGIGTSLSNDVRPLPKPRGSRRPILLGVLVLAVIAGGVALYQWETKRGATTSIPPVGAVVEAPPPLTPQLPEPERVQPEPQQEEPPPLATASLHELNGSLRIADVMKRPAEKKSEAKSAVAPATSEKTVFPEKVPVDERRKAAAVEQPLPPPAAVVSLEAGKPAKTPVIEKTDSVGSPRERSEAEYRKAIAAVNQGRVAEALEGLRNALRQDGFHVASRQLLVKLLLEAKRPEEAVQVLQDGLQGQPAQIGWAMSLARLQVDRGDFAEAWQTLNYSQPAAGSNADYQGFSGHVLQRLGRNKEAAEHYQAASRLSPGDGRWWLGLGLAMEAEGRTTEAREAFLRARQSGNLSAELTTLIEQKLR